MLSHQYSLTNYLLKVVALLILSCNSVSKDENHAASVTPMNAQTNSETTIEDNQVRAEAPDAQAKIEQGYAFPRHSPEVAQSPINIITSRTDKNSNEKISFVFHSNIAAAENLGHTIQIDFKPGSTCVVNGKNYSSAQFHFHTPSEHLLDGITFPMEMHIVNILKDSDAAENPTYLVIAFLFKMGAENNFLKEFLDKIPAAEGQKNDIPANQVKLDDLFSQIPKDEMKSYYSYKGSLTTPPYSERVNWIILKHIVEASEEQIMQIEKMEGNNARHVQAINSRKIISQ